MSETNVEKTETNGGMGPVALALTVLPICFGVLLLYLTPVLHAGFFHGFLGKRRLKI
ncbi:hypothetical protein B0T14DRAFT_505459 [Immersiella caudata]|uniref:Uncharacterized protein n=1 Tax=Immersiella caudata TaxID=314043 RepID=A0AA39XFB5_9PEZI|nr:hypothetical protein B0T14DRAFT_505459 [Immersiella caudata]